MIMQIPKKLLIHSAELITKFEPDKWGNSAEEEKIILKNIRIEYSEKNVTDTSGTSSELTATLFYDSKNSFPAAKFLLKGEIKDGMTVDVQQVKFGGKKFTVKSVEPLYADSGNIHHYEVGLV